MLAIALKRIAWGKISIKRDITIYDMGWYETSNLDFESGPKSSKNFSDLIQKKVVFERLKHDEINPDLVEAYNLLEKGLLTLGTRLSDFCSYLFDRVKIVRLFVQNGTD